LTSFLKKKKKEKKEKDNEIKQPEFENKSNSMNIGDQLKQMAYTMNFMDDFLIEEDEYDIPMFDDDIDDYQEPKQYLTKTELMGIKTYEVKLNDIFVSKPKEKQIKEKSNKEGAGYMFLKLNYIESYYLTLYKYTIDMKETTNYCTLDEFKSTLEILIKCYNNTQKK